MEAAMNLTLETPRAGPIVYPETDGQPIAENTLQFEWIVIVKEGLEALFDNDPNVFIAGDLFWYPVENHPEIRQAPDIMAAIGRPKGHRSSYRQWAEGNIAPQVVFEIRSPGNTDVEMTRKFYFYERYGVEEYYIYDPIEVKLTGWLRDGTSLKEIPSLQGWVSARLSISMEIADNALRLCGPDGKAFVSYVDLYRQHHEAERKWEQAERLRQQADRERELADLHRQTSARQTSASRT